MYNAIINWYTLMTTTAKWIMHLLMLVVDMRLIILETSFTSMQVIYLIVIWVFFKI